MTHSVFQTAQIMPLAPTANKMSSRPLLPPSSGPRSPVWTSNPLKSRKCCLTIKGSSPAVVGGDAAVNLERCFLISNRDEDAPSSSASPVSVYCGPVTKGKLASLGAVTSTLEKPKLVLPQKKAKKSVAELATGGGGGDIGKGLNHGGGDGGDDGGDDDDDDYFDDFDEGDDGDNDGLFRRRIILSELFDRKFLEAVLNEWQKTMMDLPAGFRQAYEMGLISSAQMVKFLAINARPTTERFISRALPQGMSRAFIGRMIADPAFLNRLFFELATTTGCSVWWEIKNRKERIKKEWDLALVNVLTVTACNAIVFWSLAPCRSYGNTFQFDLQNTLQTLPNNIFEKSYPLREFDFQKRLMSFFYKTAQFCMVGFTTGAIQGALSNIAASRKEERLSVTIPSVSNNALGYGAFLGLYANLRYQLLCGVDRACTNYFDVIGVALFFSTAMRMLNVQLGETSRLAWLGMEADPLVHSDDLLKAYNRPSEGASQSSSKWFISKNAIVSGLGLLGIKQGKNDSNSDDVSTPPRTRRKRIVRRKVASR